VADREVAEILGEIREQVRSQKRSELHSASIVGNGRATQLDRDLIALLKRLSVQLETLARAQDRLPPVVSNRTGWLARLELWVKGQAGRATRWYAWEQVNFNRAVTEALREIAGALNSIAHNQAAGETSYGTRATNDSDLASLASRIAALKVSSQKIEELDAEVAGLRRILDERFSQLRDEQRVLLEQILDEQRVHLKQLALEIRETALRAERDARRLEMRLDEIANRNEPPA